MVKLASAREGRMYGHRRCRNRWEYINAGFYVLAAVLLVGGFSSQLSKVELNTKSGLAVMLIGLAVLLAVNAHDLVAHMVAVDCRFSLVQFDPQYGLIELAVPLVCIVGTILNFVAVLFFFIQREKGHRESLERHALDMLVAGSALWLVGSIHSICQTYERADGHVQVLQKTVQVPLLMGSLLFVVGGIINRRHISGSTGSTTELFAKSWVWFCLLGSSMFFIGGLLNVVRVFKLQQMDGMGLEKLRGGAQEHLARWRECQVPLILERGWMNVKASESAPAPRAAGATSKAALPPKPSAPGPKADIGATSATPYKDVLVGSTS